MQHEKTEKHGKKYDNETTSLVSNDIFFLYVLQAQDSIQKKRLLTPTIEISGGTGIALYNKDFKTGYHVQQDLLYATDLLVGLDFVEPYGTLSIQSGIILDNHDFAFKYYYSFWEERVESSHALFFGQTMYGRTGI